MQQTTFPKYYALLGGSFDPFHKGHLHIAQQILKAPEIERLIFLPCGRHNFKKSSIRMEFETRFQLIQKCISDVPQMEVWADDSEEMGSGYTADLMRRLIANHPDKHFCFVIGLDNLKSLPQWHDYRWLQENVEFLVVPRPGYEPIEKVLNQIKARIIPITLSGVSSAEIRSRLAANQPISGLVPDQIEAEVVSLYSPCPDR